MAGLGYVGLANAIILAQNHAVIGFDVDANKVESINSGDAIKQSMLSPLGINANELQISATNQADVALSGADYVVIATPTDFDVNTGIFDTSSIEIVLTQVLEYCPNAVAIIRSTIPIGYCENIKKTFPETTIIFVPEFLKEGAALSDSLYPSRIIVSPVCDAAQQVAQIFSDAVALDEPKILVCAYNEAESIKLFSNSYLAMRVAFFNEVESYARHHSLNAKNIIDGISMDGRIGSHYNNPSFGYGGYCLPKDTKQLKANFQGVGESLITAIVESNETRKNSIASWIAGKAKGKVGVYRLIMKSGSDNMRESSIVDVATYLQKLGVDIVVYEPLLEGTTIADLPIENDLDAFKSDTDLIICNRYDEILDDVREKVYTPDIFSEN